MRFFDIIRFALRNFFRRKARSLLTILGVVIGTMSVVIMLSISEALDVGTVKQYEQWGSLTEITVYRGGWGDDSAAKLTDDVVARINRMENVVAVLPIRTMYVRLTKGRLEAWASVISVDASALPHFGQELELGRYMEQDGSYEVLMGYELPFNFGDPKRWEWNPAVDYDWENQTYTVNPLPFNPTEEINIKLMPDVYVEPGQPKPKNFKIQTVGVLEWKMNNWRFNSSLVMDTAAFDKLEKELNKIRGNDNNNGFRGGGMVVYASDMPMSVSSSVSSKSSTEQEQDKYDELTVKVNDMSNVMDIQKELQDWGLQAWSNMDSLEYAKEQFAFIQMILGGIGLVAFLVAALGIANTMIMSTYERTREIGVMKVMGCRLGNVLSMFLCESAIIGLFGGILGIGLSLAASYVLNTFVDGSRLGLSGFGGMQYDLSIIPLWLIGASMVFTTIVGILSGLYPSIRAMRMSVLEAIKNE